MIVEFILDIDRYLLELLNDQWQHPWLDQIMPIFRNKKTWIPLYFLLLLIVAKDLRSNTIWVLILIAITLVLSDQISSEWIKKSVERLRPCNRTDLPTLRLLIDHCGSGFSFTSSHACNHFALASQLFFIFRNKWPKFIFKGLFIWAALISYGQVYVGVHYPFDVLAGAILGIIIAIFVYSMAKKLNFIQKIAY